MTEEINLLDLENKVNSKGKYLTDFLNPAARLKIEDHFACKKDSTIKIVKYEQSVDLESTKVYLIETKLCDEYEVIDYSNLEETFKIQILKFTPNKFARKLFHKDYLGTVLGLGLRREKIGDIILTNDNGCYLFADSEIAEFIMKNLERVGHETVKITKVNSINEDLVTTNYKDRDITITSLRVDNLISHSLGISRGLSSSLIEKELVKINYVTNINNLYEIKLNDLISVRGYGRIQIIEFDGENKKGRKRVKVRIFKKEK